MVELHGEAEIRSTADKWLSTLIRRRISEIDNYYAKMMFKDAFNLVIYTIYEDIKDYTEMGDQLNPTLLKKVASAWIRMMSPVVPHLAEELWSKGFQGLVSTQPFPTEDEFNEYEETEFQVEYLKNLIESIREVENVISKEPEKIILYVDSDKERKEIVRRSLEFLNQGKGVRDFVMEVKGDETDLENIYRRMEQYDRKFRILLLKYLDTDEMKILADNVNFLIRKLNVTEISIFDSRDPMSPDVKGKKNTAVPFSPSVVII
nr:class I tRNA ligase family protein [Sulfuracidifex metallicus]